MFFNILLNIYFSEKKFMLYLYDSKKCINFGSCLGAKKFLNVNKLF